MTPIQFTTATALTLGAVLTANLLTDEVRLWRMHTALEGAASTVDKLGRRASLGDASMRQRMKLLDGQLEITSSIGNGTAIPAWAPWQSGLKIDGPRTDRHNALVIA